MNININDYLSEDEKKEIAIAAFRKECTKRTKDDFERIITNSAYDVVWSQMDEFCDKSIIAKLKNKIRSIIDDLTEFNVFRKPDAWGRETNAPYVILTDCVMDNRELLSEKVQKAIHQLPNKEMRPVVLEAMKKAIK